MPPPSQGFSTREIILVLTVVTAVAATAGTAFIRRVRQPSQDNGVLCGIRQLGAAADQYYLENGVSTVAYRDLVGATNYIKAVHTVAHETYPLYYTRGITITATGVAGARTITYAP